MTRCRHLVVLLCLALTGCAKRNDEQSVPSAHSESAPEAADTTSEDLPESHIASPAADPAELPAIAPLFTAPGPASPLPPPVGSRMALGPSSAAPPTAQSPFWTVKVFYGTNRAATGSWQPASFYDGRISDLTFGSCDVSIPKTHQRGHLESPSIWKLEFREDPRKHVALLNVRPQSRVAFMTDLQQAVWNSMKTTVTPQGLMLIGGEAFIFVHGYSNSFEDAARRTAQIAYDLEFQGAPIMYSWPSKGKWSIESYKDDNNAARNSRQMLVEFVRQVARDSGARRIHVIAHGMGNRVVAEALAQLATEHSPTPLPRFNEVILTAPDVDAREFKDSIAPHITQSAERITIYSSSSDRALQASAWLNTFNRPRLGEGGRRMTLFPEYSNIDVVDATSVATDLFGFNHSYHADNPSVLNDIELVLAGYTAEQRGLASILDHLAWQIRSLGERISSGVQNVGGAR